MSKPRLIIGISGASGIIYGIRLLQVLQTMPIETHLVVSKAAHLTRTYETSLSAAELKSFANVYHPCTNIAASIASGSFKTLGMIIAPCSMKTLGEIAHGITSNLLTRAADVTLKERRRLVLLPREAPLHLGHLQNMVTITQMGGIIFPPVPAFYNKPENIHDLIDNSVGRVLDLFDLDHRLIKRWGE
ncbi:polyprenyl P-hydroxybenzoate and phenylacrylic acid decarboxylase [Legionella oakridgensis ATCC 33761 = DSM 21215]|uniref:Flavin prenyltransferase UbiX n=3 Tax=Legionella oakridgensis TaxID=29423 RepID=W0BIC8_9GAMM|nr:UbiX family flavin prenyltransferase [Legionella oakridgensis]AHE68456.1 polyprenyl P-hydroxybenzoate and phenylacrylic acid decarboxylase [Legionella oakridgensis ATCC 33761 = DSM 21215]ETO92123.1 polyprenyl P-hydroxybenzoate and phenylacrylic acid decarboxylase [Legionella oakridgensis RV-2-2007]KTD38390.1 3-octaprenyl-4-hydroxybenzoate carboxy-lyase [Legionella oakridgensis]STY21393.1 3-octaprenyl-4-hydroxybenzoate carboxy-lyase [Legionella longbeachae]